MWNVNLQGSTANARRYSVFKEKAGLLVCMHVSRMVAHMAWHSLGVLKRHDLKIQSQQLASV